MVPQTGFEPVTRCLEGSRSILLSYWGLSSTIVPGRMGVNQPSVRSGYACILHKTRRRCIP